MSEIRVVDRAQAERENDLWSARKEARVEQLRESGRQRMRDQAERDAAEGTNTNSGNYWRWVSVRVGGEGGEEAIVDWRRKRGRKNKDELMNVEDSDTGPQCVELRGPVAAVNKVVSALDEAARRRGGTAHRERLKPRESWNWPAAGYEYVSITSDTCGGDMRLLSEGVDVETLLASDARQVRVYGMGRWRANGQTVNGGHYEFE